MLLLCFLMPILITLLVWVFFKDKFHWIELLIPTATVGLFILISYQVQKSDAWTEEYNGHIVVEARYYEYWETWVEQTCSRQVACGTESYTDSQGRTQTRTVYCTEYYDCSYCDNNSEYYQAITREGLSFSISKQEYHRLKDLWGGEKFKDLNRRINYSGGCGKDGDMYFTTWNGKVMDSKTITTTHKYQNFLKYNTSIFNFPKVEDTASLYKYPTIKGLYQNTVLGKNVNDTLRTYLNYFNADNGKTFKLRYFTLFFDNKNIDIAKQQEALWLGGNQNEIVVCIGRNKDKMEWVYVFGWCDNKLTHVNLREDLMKNDSIYLDKFYNTYQKSKVTYKYKDFKDFNYITFQPTRKEIMFIFFGSLIITIVSLLIVTLNKFGKDDI